MNELNQTQIRESFEARFGYQPSGLWQAPGRVNLIGEHTDYNGGFVLPFAIDRYTIAAISLREDDIVRVASSFSPDIHEVKLSEIKKDEANDWASYPFGVAWAIKSKAQGETRGFDCYIESNVPVGAGLSSSAAIECAVAVALNELWHTNLTRPDLARAGQLAENEIVGAPTGIMDQSASLLGETDHGVFLDCRSLESKSIKLGFIESGLELLIIDTKVAHRHADGGYASRRAACEAGAKIMGVETLRELTTSDLPKAKRLMDDLTYRRVKHVVTENDRVLETVKQLAEHGPLAIGDLMYASHISMRDDFEISVDELDLAVETALANSAIGSRMTGGGFGGAAIALVPTQKVQAITDAVLSAFAAKGFAKPEIFTVKPSQGAHKLS
ncbi:MAG: galactokinase [Micrococcales bacterium]